MGYGSSGSSSSSTGGCCCCRWWCYCWDGAACRVLCGFAIRGSSRSIDSLALFADLQRGAGQQSSTEATGQHIQTTRSLNETFTGPIDVAGPWALPTKPMWRGRPQELAKLGQQRAKPRTWRSGVRAPRLALFARCSKGLSWVAEGQRRRISCRAAATSRIGNVVPRAFRTSGFRCLGLRHFDEAGVEIFLSSAKIGKGPRGPCVFLLVKVLRSHKATNPCEPLECPDVLEIGKCQTEHQHKLSIAPARLAQSVERKALNLVVVGSSPTVGAFRKPRRGRGSQPVGSGRPALPPGVTQHQEFMHKASPPGHDLVSRTLAAVAPLPDLLPPSQSQELGGNRGKGHARI